MKLSKQQIAVTNKRFNEKAIEIGSRFRVSCKNGAPCFSLFTGDYCNGHESVYPTTVQEAQARMPIELKKMIGLA